MSWKQYQIISDGSCDLPSKLAEELHIKVVPFYVSFDGETYKKEMEELPVREFYQKMVDHSRVYPKSSMPSVEDYVKIFEPFLKEGIPILCICITTKFSGSMNSAVNARELLSDQYPDVPVRIIDSTVNTVLQGILVREAARMQQDGLSFEEAGEEIERIKSTGRILFTIGSMDYLKKGGRIGKVVGVLSGTFKIMPLIQLREGEIFPTGITRNRKKGLKQLIAQAGEHFEKTGERPEDYQVVVGYGYDYQEAVEFRDGLLASMQSYSGLDEISIYQIGATIGVHTGPYPLGIGLLKKYDR